MPTHRQFALQAAAVIFVLSMAWPYYYLQIAPWNWGFLSIGIGACAFLIAHFSHQPWWWRLIHGCFAPLLWLGQHLTISPLWHLAAFLTLFLAFRGAASGQIPLYFSGKNTAVQLAAFLPANSRLIDLGAGIGSLLLPLSRHRPDLSLTGIDNAPIPWIVGKIRSLPFSRICWRWGNIWQHNLSSYDAVYCFLSPAPMERIWHKASEEMPPGSFFISKAFPVPGVAPESIEAATEGSTDTLFIYRTPG